MKKKLLPLIITLLIFEWDMHANAQLEMVSTNLIDIGTLYNDNVATNHFTFINRGKADIKILDLISTCPCIHAKKDRDIISPGETFIMETVLNAQTVHGRFTRGIWMITDNPGQPRIPVKVSGEVLPLFSGIPTQEIILQSLDESAVFTNRLSFKPVTTNYFLNPPLANINQPNVSATLTKDENNIYHLTTIIHPDNVQLNTYNVNLPVEGPVKMSPVNLRFKVLAGVTLTASPSRLIVTRMEETYKKTFYVNIASSEKKPENLTWEPKLHGLDIKKEIYSRRPSPLEDASLSSAVLTSRPSNIRYTCTITISPEALKKLMEQEAPAITLSYPEHKPVVIPLVKLTPRTQPPAATR